MRDFGFVWVKQKKTLEHYFYCGGAALEWKQRNKRFKINCRVSRRHSRLILNDTSNKESASQFMSYEKMCFDLLSESETVILAFLSFVYFFSIFLFVKFM